MNNNPISGIYLFQRHKNLRAIFRPQPYLFHLQGHALRQIIYGFLMRPLIQCFAKAQQEAHRTRCGMITCQQGNTNGNAIQHIDSQPAAQQNLASLPNSRNRHTGCNDAPHRHREKQLF